MRSKNFTRIQDSRPEPNLVPPTSKKPKSGWVYLGESVRSDGSKKYYGGSTTRDVETRDKEHQREVGKKDSKTWVGKGKSYKTKMKFWSRNPRKDEKAVKEMSKSEKREFFKSKNVKTTAKRKRPRKSRRKSTKTKSQSKRKKSVGISRKKTSVGISRKKPASLHQKRKSTRKPAVRRRTSSGRRRTRRRRR